MRIWEDFWYVFLCCIKNICWNCQLVTNLFQVSMFFRLIPLDYRQTAAWFRPDRGKWKWNESGFRPPLCTYRLNWARRTSWGWWDDWDDTVLQTQDSKFEPWRSEAEHATSRSRRLPTILTFTRGWGRNNSDGGINPRSELIQCTTYIQCNHRTYL